MIVMRVGSTLSQAQQNRQRAPRDGAESHEHDAMSKSRHAA